MTKLVACASYINRVFLRKNSTLTLIKNVMNCGATMAQKYVSSTVHGPTCYEITKDLDLSNKTCLITGANSGIGLEMTRCLSMHGCTVLMLCRNKYAAGLIAKNSEHAEFLRLYETNLASLRSVKRCSDEILKNEKQIDIVILNAAVFGLPWTLTEDALETTFQVNYLSQYHLLTNIESILAPNARVVFMSSESHRNINWSIRNIMVPCEETLSLPSHEYTSIKAYNISKLCGLLAMHYFGYRWMKTFKRVYSAHPGSFVKTRLCRNWWPYEALYTSMLPFTKTISQAAATPVYCATSPDLEGISTVYYKNLKRCDESELAKNLNLAFRVNDLTNELLHERADVLTLDADAVEEAVPTPIPQKETVQHTLTPEYSA